MASPRFVNKLIWRSLLLLTLLLICWNEIFVYYINAWSWHPIKCEFGNCTRILFVADPQLLGDTFDTSFYSSFAKFDSDRYLEKTFRRAVTFAQPHLICFLGDLFDEGNVASMLEYENYATRFKHIYRTNDKIQHIHIPGDNDIGGENGAYISNMNLNRFENVFTRHDVFDYDSHIRFFKINRMLMDYNNPDPTNNYKRLRVAVSHAPLLIGGGPLLRGILKDIDPHVIFSAHWHESRIFLYPSSKVVHFYENTVRHFYLDTIKERDHTYLEIMVPTASYRMGKTKIGVGYAVFEANNKLSYTVLWLPNRFVYLLTYVFWLIIAMCGMIVFKMMTRCPFRRRVTSYH